MEDIARGVSPALVCFADGTALICSREHDDETGFAETERFLDEEYPTSISTFCVRDARGAEYRALLNTKHFLNHLYLSLLTGGNPDRDADYLPHFSEQWYAHTPIRQRCERYYDHYRISTTTAGALFLTSDSLRKTHEPDCLHLHRLCRRRRWIFGAFVAVFVQYAKLRRNSRSPSVTAAILV